MARQTARAPRVVRDPRLLPYFLKKGEAAALARVSERTVDEWCRKGNWKRGVQFTVPNRRRRVFLRDGVLRWLEEQERRGQGSKRIRSKVNLEKSP